MSKFRHTRPAPDPAAVAAFAAGAETRSTTTPTAELVSEDIKRITLRLDRSRWRKLKTHCLNADTSVQQFLVDALDAALLHAEA